eukprot:TRINITY_DN7467_c0_g1_i1.p1 TRINITY_DN7467_c0_g1~~TRINITY_DN7467_c0_g1_i1.p1  ORF type:complete len:345 (+),score=131.70 TRINITY_DN7467_c0_g1_i1:53-1036(+)
MSKIPANLQDKWAMITKLKYAQQCKWLLNGFWDILEKDCECFWLWHETFVKLDQQAKSDGYSLDEFWSHKFLESLGETMTVIQMRENFRTIDADFNKRIGIIEYAIYKYKLQIPAVCNAPQGENKEAVAKAQAMVDAAQASLDELTRKLQQSKEATERANHTAAEAAKAVEIAAQAEAEDKKALDELRRQEESYQNKIKELETLKEDANVGIVRRNKASNELDQLRSEDPLPLRKAKITQQATLKKSERARLVADQAKAQADADAMAAATAEKEVETAMADAERSFDEALAELEKAKKLGGVANGDIWWMQRELEEKKKYLPKSKQK